MTPDRWARIKDVFAAVIDHPADTRSTVLTEMCNGDQDLQSHVEQLLSQHDEMGNFLDSATAPLHRDEHPLEPGQVLAGRYRIVELLGSGGMGEVYEAEDQELGERIALKVIRQQASIGSAVVDRLRREVQLARRVTHPNVCRVFDLGYHRQDHSEIIFLTMELIRGETLSARLKRVAKLERAEALPIAVQLCEALEAAHLAGVLHRDFKCSNVMLIGSGQQVRAVVTDFGIARGMPSAGDVTGTITKGMVFGTPSYMSPEQILGKSLTKASDIYSLGLVLYEMVTGVRPFHEESSWTEALKRLTENPPEPISSVPQVGENWNVTILKCLEREPDKRFSSTKQVIDSLRYGPPASSWSRTAIAALASGLLIVTAATYFFFSHVWFPPLPAQKHLAVMPFAFSGNDPADRATAYGLAQALTDNLARLQVSESSLWVVPWSEVGNQKPEDASRAASSLGVNLLLTGNLKKNDGKLYLQADLKDAKTLNSLRSQTLEVPQTEVITVEDKLLERAAAMLDIKVPEGMLHHLPVDETTVPGAYEFYEQGKGYLQTYDSDNAQRAIVLFKKAIEGDSNFALAYANLGFAYSLQYRRTFDSKWHDLAGQACARALSLNNKLASAHSALASFKEDSGDLDGAISEFEQALALDPTDDETRNLLSMAYDKAGRLLQAEELLKGAMKRHPGSWVNYNDLGYFYFRHGQYSHAEPLFQNAADLAPDNSKALYNLGGTYLVLGKYKEAETILAKAVALKPTYAAYSNLGSARVFQGHYAEGAAMFQKAAELSPSDERVWRNLGDAYTLENNQAQAAEAYTKARKLAEQAVAARPNDTEAHASLALYCAKLGQQERARRELVLAERSSPNGPDFLFTSLLVDELTGQRERAWNALRSTLRSGYPLVEIQNAPELKQLRAEKQYAQIVQNYTANKP